MIGGGGGGVNKLYIFPEADNVRKAYTTHNNIDLLHELIECV